MPNNRSFRLLQETLRHSVELYPDKVAVVSGADRITYAELWEQSVAMAHALRRIGVSRGDRVAIFLDNTWHCPIALYGTLLADAAFVIINPQTKGDKLSYILKDCSASALIADHHLRGVFMPAIADSQVKGVIAAGQGIATDAEPRLLWWDDALAESAGMEANARSITVDLCSLIYTSGSTGEPKGVMHTHQSMVFALQSLVEYLRLDETDSLLCVLPLAFDYGMYQLLMAMSTGATLVLERSFTYPAQVFKSMQAEGVTVFPGVPTVFAMLLAAHERQSLEFPLVRRVTNTAAALPSSFNTRLREIFPRADLYRMYGLTECKRVSFLPPSDVDRKPESVGIAIPGTEVMVLDDGGRHVAPGQVGKLYVRGAHVMLGYWNQPEKSAHMLKPGRFPGERVLCTHDLFTVDEDGYLYFVGRSDDIIKCRGEKVSPIEVEAVLFGIGGIREAAVIGVPHPVLGQAVHAYVNLADGSTLDEHDVKRICGEKLEAYMVPQRVVFLPELPKSANGKIDKKALAGVHAA
ncbi:MAG: Long-chain-fatty-acid--CoA ligase [Gammaproteobacteria bacterium]|nr:Long-chain-fatty-acid--CoA ligase [Gammaproteobacteria bacterium]